MKLSELSRTLPTSLLPAAGQEKQEGALQCRSLLLLQCLRTVEYKNDSLGLHQVNFPKSFSPALTGSGVGIDGTGSNP